ncbi:MAG: HlyD family secretion protein [Hyphomicrobiaceae bacterium]
MLKIVATGLAVVGLTAAAGFWIAEGRAQSSAAPATTSNQANWVAAALGRVEPRSGDVKIGATVLGRIAEVLVRDNEQVEEGQLIIRLDDDEARARLVSAEAEAGGRKSDRDSQTATAGREDVRKAEDNMFSTERAVTGARFELDYALAARRSGSGTEQQVNDARRRLQDARDRLQRDRIAYANAQAKSNLPSPNRFEAALSSARSNVALAEVLLDKTRIRAPIAGRILVLNAKVGETAAPSPEIVLAVVGDTAALRVKAELDEADAGKVRIGQRTFVRSVAHPGQDFEGRVTAIAPALTSAKLTARGPRRPTDVEVLEVTVELDGRPALVPGMRVDTFFRRD